MDHAAPITPSVALNRVSAAIRAVAPHLDDTGIATWTAALTPQLRSGGITTPKRVAMFLGQCAVESAGFTALSEDCYYSDPARIRKIFPDEVPDLETASSIARNPEALANLVYADRNGNGDVASGDGYRFRGGGLIQLTGRENYTKFGSAVGRSADDAAAWVRTPPGAAASASWFWTQHRLNVTSDGWEVTETTRIINPGLAGLQDRLRLCNAALDVFR